MTSGRFIAAALLGALYVLVAVFAAEAYVRSGPGVMPHGHHRLKASGALPLDGLPATAAYSFRKLRSAYAGPAMRLLRTDTATLDVGFIGVDFDTSAATAFCTATTCGIQIKYDQSGNGRDVASNPLAAEPVYVASCAGGKPCMQSTLATQVLTGPTYGLATGVVTISVVANRNAGTGTCSFLRVNGSAGNNAAARIQGTSAVANQWLLVGGASGSVFATVTDNAWHAAIGIVNGAASEFDVDGVIKAGSTTGGTVAAVIIGHVGAASTTCSSVEEIFWDNLVVPTAAWTALVNGQRAYWGF